MVLHPDLDLLVSNIRKGRTRRSLSFSGVSDVFDGGQSKKNEEYRGVKKIVQLVPKIERTNGYSGDHIGKKCRNTSYARLAIGLELPNE